MKGPFYPPKLPPEASGFDINWRILYYIFDERSKFCFALFCFMTRSLRKGPYVDPKLLKKISEKKPETVGVVKTWSRDSQISPEMVGFTFGVHNGKEHIPVRVTEEMVGNRLGEFSPTKKFIRHGGKMQKELEQKKREAEISAAKAVKTAEKTKK